MMALKVIAGTILFVFIWFVIFAVILVQPGHASPQCDMRENVLALLADRYGEQPVVMGVAGQAAVMEVFANDSTGTWSLTMTMPDGMTCLMASGTDYAAMRGQLPANL